MSDSGNDNSENRGGAYRPVFLWVMIIAGVLILLTFMNTQSVGGTSENIKYSVFLEHLHASKIKSVTIESRSGEIRGEYQTAGKKVEKGVATRFTTKANPESLDELEPKLLEYGVVWENTEPHWLRDMAPTLLMMALLALLFYFLIFRQMRGGGGGGILSFGKSKAVRVTRDKNRKTFDDVAGIDEAREEVEEIIDFLRTPEKFQRLGGRLPKGVLLIGPPGMGKTLLAKAIAGEADVPFFSISGSDFVEMFVGVGASRVRDPFDQAKTNSPCIIFLDEIDAVGRKRANDLPGSGVETAQTLNQILVEMDGFTSDDSVIVIAATNRPDVLDPALLRPGRFDRHINVDPPDIRGRQAILDVHGKKVKLGDNVDMHVVARGTPSFSGADLENVVNEAALIAVMKGKDAIYMDDFEEARDKVRFGKANRSRVMSTEDRHDTAVHEAGHAILMLKVEHVTPLHKVTIIPRGRALGATMQLPEKDQYSMGRRQVLGEVKVLLGGRAAEDLFLEDVTTGASNDFERATELVRSMICDWGMSDALGMVHYDRKGDSDLMARPVFSEATAEKIDKEVRAILDEAYAEAREVLEAHRQEVDLLVEALMEFELLSREEVELIFNDGHLSTLRARRKEQGDQPPPSMIAPPPATETRKADGGNDNPLGSTPAVGGA